MTSRTAWSSSTGIPPLKRDEVCVWRVFLDQDTDQTDRLLSLLSADERERADRFYFPYLRTRYIAARGALRQIAGALVRVPPARLTLAYTQHGKPHLPGSPLRFNLSHANQLGLIACSLDREIGIDIEYHRPMADRDQLAQRFFSAPESSAYMALEPALREQAFFNCWTRKEAYIKAIGDGLRYPLDAFQVSLLPGEPARLVSVDSDPVETSRWKMMAIDPGPEYTAAILAEGPDWALRLCDFIFQ